MNHSDKISSASGKCFSMDILKDYAAGNLSHDQMYSVEKHIHECEICSDILDGLMLMDNNQEFDLMVDQLNLKIDEKTEFLSAKKNKKRPLWIYPAIAAAVVILILSTVVLLNQYQDTKIIYSDNQLPLSEQETISTVTDKEITLSGEKAQIEGQTDIKREDNLREIDNTVTVDMTEETGKATKKGEGYFSLSEISDNEDITENQQKEIGTVISGDVKTMATSEIVITDAVTLYPNEVEKSERLVAEQKNITEAESKADKFSGITISDSNEKDLLRKSAKDNRAKVSQEEIVKSKDADDYKSNSVPFMSTGADDTSKKELAADESVNLAGGISDPDGAIDVLPLAKEKFNQKEYAEARGLFEQKLEDNPNNYESLFYSAVTYLMLKEPEKAIINLDKVLMIENGEFYQPARYYKAIALIQNDQPGKAKPILEDLGGKGGEYQQKALDMLKEIE